MPRRRRITAFTTVKAGIITTFVGARRTSVFNLNDGGYRCPNSQQGTLHSAHGRVVWPGLCGYPEQLEFFALKDSTLKPFEGRRN